MEPTSSSPPPSSPVEDERPPTPPTAVPSPVPPPVPVDTHPNRAAFKPPLLRQPSDPSRLAPEDAFKTYSQPPRLRPLTEIHSSAAAVAAAAALRPAVASLRKPPAIPPVAARLAEQKRQRREFKRGYRPKEWKKLLWIPQPGFPDNYTDTEKFLDHLQRPELKPYEFWPLVADSTVIVQHVCSVGIFICAYAGIYQGRLSPLTVVSCGSVATIIGWFMWDSWMGQEEERELNATRAAKRISGEILDDRSSTSSVTSSTPAHANGHANGHVNGHVAKPAGKGLGLTLSTSNLAAKNIQDAKKAKHGQSASRTSFQSISPIDGIQDLSPVERFSNLQATPKPQSGWGPASHTTSDSGLSPRTQARLKTFKSALLIYFALLGLSPILKSLTRSTSSDSIWALATWLLIINIFFFDYGSLYVPKRPKRTVVEPSSPTSGPVEPSLTPVHTMDRSPPFPSSLSTNAALMASTVLASRLLTTTAVFTLTLFSIQVFGLFPVFRRHLKHESWSGNVLLTMALVAMSSSGLGLILSQSYTHTYGDCGFCWSWIWHVIWRSFVGLVVGGFGTMFILGGCSWWLIGLQRYKNVVMGPWDPARPVLAGGMGRHRGSTD